MRLRKRGSGVLLHISSLPSRYGIGDFGPNAYQFVDILKKNKQKYWQILPLTPTDSIYGDSPYSSPSAFAGNILFISPALLLKDRLISKADLKDAPRFSKNRAHYPRVFKFKKKLLKKAYKNFSHRNNIQTQYKNFCRKHKYWLHDFALFSVLHRRYLGRQWNQWPKSFRDREPQSLKSVSKECSQQINQIKFEQFLFFTQWERLSAYCGKKNIQIIGDIPIYVNFHSVDVWTHPELFKLKYDLSPKFVSGVPPDYFSATGQRWGNPVYNWKILKKMRYSWWIERIRHNIRLYDYIRIDHFRGFAAYWQIPVQENTAVKGRWIKVPGSHFFKTLKRHFQRLPIIAEDIGYITPDVIQLIQEFDFPGMKVLQFAFDDTRYDNGYLPHHYAKNCVVYTGTHDNNTIRGWFRNEVSVSMKKFISEYLNQKVSLKNIHWALLELAFNSVARIAIFPIQDLLGLGQNFRMNTPGTGQRNWQWRLKEGDFTSALQRRLRQLTKKSKRI